MSHGETPGALVVYKNKLESNNLEKRDDEDSIQICQRIIDIYEFLQKHKERPSLTIECIDTWTKFAQENRVTFDDDVLKSHRFFNEIKNLKSSNTKGRLVTIGKEVATMTTSLPAGIFVKVSRRSVFFKFQKCSSSLTLRYHSANFDRSLNHARML